MKTKTVQCVLCGKYSDRTFACNKCRKRPLCLTHRDPKLGFCVHCAAEIKTEQLNTLRPVATSLSVFIKLLEFIFVIAAIFFAAQRFIPGYIPPYLEDNVFTDHLHFWGWVSGAGIVLIWAALFIIKRKMRGIENMLDGLGAVQRGHVSGRY